MLDYTISTYLYVLSRIFHRERQHNLIGFIKEDKLIFPIYSSTLFTESLQPFCELGNHDPYIHIRKKCVGEVKESIQVRTDTGQDGIKILPLMSCKQQ